ncbi:ABC transporter substrate-binding protein [Morganella morganii]|uniref:ABC transporter substrate-binding protein n=1 Tax=Morganella morganii TaxID=582 RepID=UPI0034D58201
MKPLFTGLLLMMFSLLCGAKTVTDSLGRTVTVPDDPQRIVLGESRMLYTLALIETGNPVARVVGWPADLQRLDPQTLAKYTAAFPAIRDIAIVGNDNFSQLNIEKIIALQPNLIIMPVYAKSRPDETQFAHQTAAAGIPVIYLDFRVDPLRNTVPSLKTLGEVLNRQEKTAAFIAFYQQHMDVIRSRLAMHNPHRPKVLLRLHLGKKAECCTTAASGNLADLLAFSGGDNIAAGKFSGVFGRISPEQVLSDNPEYYLVTGSGGRDSRGQLQLGPDLSPDTARQSLQEQLQKDPVIAALPAVREGRTAALWHHVYLSPWHLLAAEFFARELHPDLFSDVDPQKTLDEMNRRFLSVPETGTYWLFSR